LFRCRSHAFLRVANPAAATPGQVRNGLSVGIRTLPCPGNAHMLKLVVPFCRCGKSGGWSLNRLKRGLSSNPGLTLVLIPDNDADLRIRLPL
jgi:hypothetical protein